MIIFLGCDGIMSTEEKNTKTSAEVIILGESLKVVGQSSPDYIKNVAKFVNQKLSELVMSYPKMSRNKVVILGVMNIADELFKLKKQMELYRIELDNLRKEREDLELAFVKAQKLVQHYQKEYEELALLLEEEE